MKKTNHEGNQVIAIDANTDFRFLKPLDAEELVFVGIDEESNKKIVQEAQIDDRTPDYRDALIDAMVNEYNKYLDRYQIETDRQHDNICSGATIQLIKAKDELQLLNELMYDNVF